MKLYTSRRAPNPRRVAWVLAEKGVEGLEVVDLDLLKGDHKTDAFREMFGLAQVPALVLDDGTALTESVAIARYLESLHPEPNLFGRDPRETAVVEMWTRRVEMGLATPCMMAVRYSHPALAALEPPDSAAAEKARGQAAAYLGVLQRRLADSAFIAADRLTMADIIAYCSLDFARMVRFEPDPALTDVIRWREAMKARPAARAGL